MSVDISSQIGSHAHSRKVELNISRQEKLVRRPPGTLCGNYGKPSLSLWLAVSVGTPQELCKNFVKL